MKHEDIQDLLELEKGSSVNMANLNDEEQVLTIQHTAIRSAFDRVALPEATGYEALKSKLSNEQRPWWKRNPQWIFATSVFAVLMIAIASVPKGRAEGGFTLASADVAAAAPPTPADGAMAPKAESPESRMAFAPGKKRSGSNAETNGGLFIERTTNMTLNVVDASSALKSIENEAKLLGGYVEMSSFTDQGPNSFANVSVRVPSGKLEALKQKAVTFGTLLSIGSSANDITTETMDVDARLRALRIEEEQYLLMLRQARNVSEMLKVRQPLGEVRSQIESLTAQQKGLKLRANMAVCTFELVQRPTGRSLATSDPNWSRDALKSAQGSLRHFGQKIARALIFVGVYSVVWIPALIVAIVLWRRSRRGIL